VQNPGKFVFESGSQTSQLEASGCKIEHFHQTAGRHICENLTLHQRHARASISARNILSFMQPQVSLVSAQSLGIEWLADSS
jgi:hypothetical protein